MKPAPIFNTAPTLFIAAGVRSALLVTPTRAGHRATRKRFQDARAALTWCEARGANMVYTSQPSTQKN